MYNILIRAKQNKALPAILDSFVENFQIFSTQRFSNKLIEAILSDNVDEFISVCSMPDFNFIIASSVLSTLCSKASMPVSIAH
ncbi:hypothetical protein TVAGG3_0643460 [Trichomonas vaginalis G3]|uniref:hypothetical protein n=1 Tax=Trichomonas vaginalis (strain ATCC PRA-98 / G3) TaxID=412133 RepID=UPI0021E5EAC5|nr:hypothetical protein TVAGG3_0643460 [Trichomonas vaginalis G3]KAI5505340.1 hypothetical protein TVAGG3_0643460 [Trichomonas vaginalis G3]